MRLLAILYGEGGEQPVALIGSNHCKSESIGQRGGMGGGH